MDTFLILERILILLNLEQKVRITMCCHDFDTQALHRYGQDISAYQK